MKTRVVPSNMKPLRPIRSHSSHQPNPSKLFPSRSVKINNKSMSHLLKFDEVGLFSAKGQRFTDRHLLGKHNLVSKIISVKIYLDKVTNMIAGIQCTYLGNKAGGDNIKRDKDARENQYTQESFACKTNTFVRSITGTVSPNDRIESLMFTTSDGTSHRFGVNKTTQKHFTLDISSEEFPVCVYGSLLVTKEAGKRATCELEFLGFQIQNEAALYKSAHMNEFDP